MNDFISTVRTDRLREISELEKRGIAIANKYTYKIVDYIDVVINDTTTMRLGVQADQRDVYFYLVDEGANEYFTIIEIYRLLKKVCEFGNGYIVFELLENIRDTEMRKTMDNSKEADGGEKWENRGDFIYRGVTYHMKKIKYPEYNRTIDLEDGARSITYQQLFVLVNIIQEKSNAFFTRGESKNNKMVNGLVRLFTCLLKLKKDNEVLKERGWLYDKNNDRFYMDKSLSQKREQKYYLTKEEFLNIISSES